MSIAEMADVQRIPEKCSADGGAGFALQIGSAERGHMLIDPGQALQHQDEIHRRELAVCAPFQAGAAQAGATQPIRVVGRRGPGGVVGVRHGGPLD